MARAGVDGVNMHTYRGATYEMFTFKRVGGTWTAYVAPQYYGMLLFAQAAPTGSHLESVAGAGGPLRAWATSTGLLAGGSRITRVAATNDRYRVRLPAASAALLTLPKPRSRRTMGGHGGPG